MDRSHRRSWLIVAVSLFGISTGPAAFGIASIGVLSGPIIDDLGWTRTELSAAVSAMMLCTALCLPFAGRFIDRFGSRRVLIPSLMIMALCMAGLATVQSFWHFLALYVAMGTVAVGTNSTAYMRVITGWFDQRRGLAIGIAGSGTGLGFAYVPLLSQYFLEEWGWRAAYLGLAGLLVVVTLPLVAFLLSDAPTPAAELSDDGETAADSDGVTMAQAMRMPDFWIMGGIFVVLAFVLYGLIPHLVPLLQDRGISANAAAGIASLFGLAAFGGRLLIGFMIDRFDARRIAFVFFSLSAVGLLMLIAPLPYWGFIAAAVLLGVSLGAEVDMLAYLASRYFGLRCFAQIFSTLFSAVMVAMGLGPLAFGAIFDLTGSYIAILATGVPICLLASALVLRLSPYAERARGGQVTRT